ncbi:MAG: hypothetical protein ABIC95_02570 [archaeon]
MEITLDPKIVAQLYDGTNVAQLKVYLGQEQLVIDNVHKQQVGERFQPVSNAILEVKGGKGRDHREGYVSLDYVTGHIENEGDVLIAMPLDFQAHTWEIGAQASYGPCDGSHMQFNEHAMPILEKLLVAEDEVFLQIANLTMTGSEQLDMKRFQSGLERSKYILGGIAVAIKAYTTEYRPR